MEPYERLITAVHHQCPDIAEAISRQAMEFYRERALRAIEASDGQILGKDGGYIVCPAHALQPDTPVENILALYEIANEYQY